jgi:hypothetical protein
MIVQVRAHRPVTRRVGVAETLDGELAPEIDRVEFDLADVSRVDDNGQKLLSIDVLIDDRANTRALDLPDPGLYPVSIQIRRDGQLAAPTHITFVERISDVTLGPFSLAVLAGVDDVGSRPTNRQLARAHDQLERVADLAERVTAPITVRIPPVLIDTVLADDPALYERLTAALAGDSVLAVPDLPLDPSAAAEAGLGLEFVRRLRDGETALTQAFPGAATQRSAWIVDEPLTADGASSLRDLGTQLLVMSFDRYLGLDGHRGELTDTSLLLSTTLPDTFPLAIALVDEMMALLDPDVDSGNTPTEDAVRVMAEIAGLRQQLALDRRSFVISTPDLGIPDADVVVQLERLATGHPDFGFQSVAALTGLTNSFFVDGEVVTLELDDQPAVDLSARASAVNASRQQAADVGSMLPAADSRPRMWDEALRVSLTTGVDDIQAASIVGDVDHEIASIRGAVLPPESFTFTVGGRQADIPLRFTNSGDVPLNVIVHLEAEKLTFPANELPVELAANGTTEVPIAVEARSNGQFPVRIELRTPAGNRLTDPIVLTAKVNNFSGLGRVVTVGAVLVLATWWATYLKRRRKASYARRVEDSVGRHPTANGV